MFILAFFGFLRCSELAIPSSFDPAIHPTISDLAVLDDETISYTIKQSKTDQTKKGHFIYIFKLQSPLSPYQTLLAFLHLRKSQSKLPSDPLFTDDSNRPATRFWFQKHLKAVLHLSGTPAGNFQPFIPNRRSNHSGPQRPFPTADPRTRSLVVRGFQKLHSTKPLPHQGSPPDPNRPPPLEYTSETP